MIYILERVLVDEWTWNTTTVKHVFEVPNGIDVVKEYRDHILEVAKTMSVVVNPHWFNLMNHEDHHPHLSESEYLELSEAWEKTLKVESKFSFLKSLGQELEFKDLSESL